LRIKPVDNNLINNENIVISIVIPCYNEEDNIIKLLEAINRQTYDLNLVEVIVVDDSSTDNTYKIVEKYKDNRELGYILHLIKNENGNHGKKYALTEGIRKSTGVLILTVDADSIPYSDRWIEKVVGYYKATNNKLIILPVIIDGKTIIEYMQAIEMSGLMVVTASTSYIGNHLLCNGANMAFEKAIFLELRGYEGNDTISTGDDIFLLMKLKKQMPNKIGFMKNIDVAVITQGENSLSRLINQRLRWASKVSYVRDNYYIYVSMITFLANLMSLLFILMFMFLEGKLFKLILFTIFIRFLAEYIMLYFGCKFFDDKKIFYKYILPAYFFNIFYSTVVGFMVLFKFKYKWRGD